MSVEFKDYKKYFNVRIDGLLFGSLENPYGVWKLSISPEYPYYVEATDLREMAQKLDSLNGVNDE